MSETANVASWAEIIDDYARTVASLEHRLDADAWTHDVPPFEVPGAPMEAPTEAQVHRFAELQRRAERCNDRIREQLDDIRSDVAQLDVRRTAARTYGGQ